MKNNNLISNFIEVDNNYKYERCYSFRKKWLPKELINEVSTFLLKNSKRNFFFTYCRDWNTGEFTNVSAFDKYVIGGLLKSKFNNEDFLQLKTIHYIGFTYIDLYKEKLFKSIFVDLFTRYCYDIYLELSKDIYIKPVNYSCGDVIWVYGDNINSDEKVDKLHNFLIKRGFEMKVIK